MYKKFLLATSLVLASGIDAAGCNPAPSTCNKVSKPVPAKKKEFVCGGKNSLIVALRAGVGFRMANNDIKEIKDEASLISTLATTALPHEDKVSMDIDGKLGYVAGLVGADAYFFSMNRSSTFWGGLFGDVRFTSAKYYLNDAKTLKQSGSSNQGGSGNQSGSGNSGVSSASVAPVVSPNGAGNVGSPVVSSTLMKKHHFSFLVGPSVRIYSSPNLFFTVGAGLYGQESKFTLKTEAKSKESSRVWQLGAGAKVGAFYRMSQGLFFGAEASGHITQSKAVKIEETNLAKLSFKANGGFGGMIAAVVGYDLIGGNISAA